jgi:DNA-binding transcriptional ArsR family regulator
MMATAVTIDPERLYALSADLRQMAETLSPPKPKQKVSAEVIRSILRARRMRDVYFNPELFADPAWDMLLDLLAAKLEGRHVSVTSLCGAAAVPPTTALRWIGKLEEEGLIIRTDDTSDSRRVLLALSDDAAERLTAYLAAAHSRTELLT